MALNQVGLERLNTATTKKIGTRKNLIINGAMQVAQRGTSSTTANTYSTVDRNQIRTSGVDEAPTIAQVDVYLVTNTGDDVYIIRNAPVPAGSSLEIISGSKIIMESSDVLRIRSGTATALDVAVSYLEQT